MIWLRMVNGLVAEMADRTICVRARMVVGDAAQDHHEHQQREQRNWYGEISKWSAFMHVTTVGAIPNPYHIRRWLFGVNGLRGNRPKTHGHRRPHLAGGWLGLYAGLIRLFERLFDHGDAFFDAFAQRAFDFLLAFAQREGFVGNIQRGEHRDLQ